MPALTQAEFQELCQSLSGFSVEALARTIEQARDPDKAGQLVNRLRQAAGSDDEGFVEVALCVVLGEARSEQAIPLLLELGMDDTRADEPAASAARYALQRMGRPAFEKTMRRIESSPDPGPRVLGYEILAAAEGSDPITRRWVGDFCLDLLASEPDRGDGDEDWSPGLAAADVLVSIKDQRAASILADRATKTDNRDDQGAWKELAKALRTGERRPVEANWREDWESLCADWADELASEDEEDDDDEDEAEDSGGGLDYDGDIERRIRASHKLLDEFSGSACARSVEGYSGSDAACELAQFFEFAYGYTALDFEQLQLADLREAAYEWLPRKFSAGPEFFRDLPLLLEAFFKFLQETGRLPGADRFLAFAREARTRLPALAADRGNWGMAKSMFVSGQKAGFDMNTEQGFAEFVRIYNERLLLASAMECAGITPDQLSKMVAGMAERLGVDPDTEEGRRLILGTLQGAGGPAMIGRELKGMPEPVEAIRRAEPKISRNAPCPCGSGRKYKKCCGHAS